MDSALIARRHGGPVPGSTTKNGADGGTRTRTSRGKQILSLLRLPVSPRPHACGIVDSAAPVKRKAADPTPLF
ncbi:MAG: hypothetical protein RL764_1454 [Pseudomonadota bacterium]